MNIVFATTELDPVVPGGAGTLIADLTERLAEVGHTVRVVLVGDHQHQTLAGHVVPAVPGTTDWEASTPFLTASRAAAETIAALEPTPDLVEFIDFHGLGYWALMRREVLGLRRVPIVIRLHGPLDLILETMDVVPDDQAPMRVMERESYRMADSVVVPSAGFAEVVVDRFDVEPERVRIGEPPVPAAQPQLRQPSGRPEIVCFGRLGEVKGSEDFLRAVLPLLEDRLDLVVRFVGPDGWDTARHQSMEATLRSLVPESAADRVRFEGPVAREAVPEALASAWFVVIPSRFESFCLTAHEARAYGHPVVIADLPAFRPYFTEATGALVYEGSLPDLTQAMERLLSSESLRTRLATAPVPEYGDPLAPYRPLEPRHPHSQSGLATAAFQRVEAAVRPPRPEPVPSWKNRLMRGTLERLPEPLAGSLEQRMSRYTRFNAVNAWRLERAQTDWLRRTMAELRQGVLEVTEPEVSVVIPCFNQGQFVHEAILSVFRQDFDSWEIVVVDDGSTDPRSQRILKGLRYPRTRLIRQENRGLSAARNVGMRAARGRYLVPLDADDELGAGFLSAMHRALAMHPGAAMAHCWPRLFGDQDLVWVNRPYNPYQLLLSNSLVGCVLMRAQAFRDVGGYDEHMRAGNEDWDLWIRFLEHGWGQVEVPSPLFRYRKHGISMSVTTLARFETARQEMVKAHPSLYAEAALRARKAEWYPLVSVVTGSDHLNLATQTLGDIEVVPIGESPAQLQHLATERSWPLRPSAVDLPGAVASARGKYLIVWDAIRGAAPDLLERLADALEADEDAYVAWASPSKHPALWRRWALLDPGADLVKTVEIAVPGEGGALDEKDFLGAFPNPRWAINTDAYAVPVRQVRPETEGRFPAWVR